MYVTALVIPVPESRLEDYRRWAENSAGIFRRHGCIESVEAVGDVIPEGKGEIPFDPTRLILGCFAPLHVMGRTGAGA